MPSESAGLLNGVIALPATAGLPTPGGGNTLDNLVVLGSGCHRRLHENDTAARASLRQVPI